MNFEGTELGPVFRHAGHRPGLVSRFIQGVVSLTLMLMTGWLCARFVLTVPAWVLGLNGTWIDDAGLAAGFVWWLYLVRTA